MHLATEASKNYKANKARKIYWVIDSLHLPLNFSEIQPFRFYISLKFGDSVLCLYFPHHTICLIVD